MEDSSPTWSPDATQIAYTRALVYGRSNTSEIFVQDLDDGSEWQITSNTLYEGTPSWSPSGEYFAFVGGVSSQPPELYVVDANGGNLTQLTINMDGYSDPAWSLDSRMIVVTTGGENPGERYLLLFDLSGRSQRLMK